METTENKTSIKEANPVNATPIIKEEIPFIRIGTTYYKVASQPQPDGTSVIKRLKWDLQAIKFDYGKQYPRKISRFNGFCTVPLHKGYKREIKEFYNLYEPISHEPKEGDWDKVSRFISHIFGDQYELGLDYLQILYLYPIQKLPILLLVSEERNTGKTTFLNFLKLLFEDNATFNTNEDFRSKFNSDWTAKLLILIDEVLLNRREDSERLKNLSTAKSYKAEAKGKDRDEIGFFAKFVMCSNNERTPVLIDPGEIRYWVRKIEPLESDETDFLAQLKKQIPAFLYFLENRQLSSRKESRMWFHPKKIFTPALTRIIRSNKNRIEMELIDLLRDIMILTESESVCYCINDITQMFYYSDVKADRSEVRKVVQDIWKLHPAPNALSYKCWERNITDPRGYSCTNKTGRYYTFTKTMLDTL